MSKTEKYWIKSDPKHSSFISWHWGVDDRAQDWNNYSKGHVVEFKKHPNAPKYRLYLELREMIRNIKHWKKHRSIYWCY